MHLFTKLTYLAMFGVLFSNCSSSSHSRVADSFPIAEANYHIDQGVGYFLGQQSTIHSTIDFKPDHATDIVLVRLASDSSETNIAHILGIDAVDEVTPISVSHNFYQITLAENSNLPLVIGSLIINRLVEDVELDYVVGTATPVTSERLVASQ